MKRNTMTVVIEWPDAEWEPKVEQEYMLNVLAMVKDQVAMREYSSRPTDPFGLFNTLGHRVATITFGEIGE